MRKIVSVWMLVLSLTLSLNSLTYAAESAKWVALGTSELGQHEVDVNSLQWIAQDPQSAKSLFNIITRVLEGGAVAWVTTINIDCAGNQFSYIKGGKFEHDKLVGGFDKAKPAEPIASGSMPDQLKQAYCPVTPESNTAESNESNTEATSTSILAESERVESSPPQAMPTGQIEWESIGKSNIAEVFYDRKSIRRSKDGLRFIAHTRVVPFSNPLTGEQEGDVTLSTLSFDCTDHTFMVVRMSKLVDDQLISVFDTPQAPAHTDKIATIQTLANRFCANQNASAEAKSPEQIKKDGRCTDALSQVEALEANVQKDIEGTGLVCKQAKRYVRQIQQLAKVVKHDDCPIDGLDSFAQQVNNEKCR